MRISAQSWSIGRPVLSMADHEPVYRYSLREAIRNEEQDLWRESLKESCDCARAIEHAIGENYHDNRLDDCAKAIIERYGFNRVNWVLANTVQQKAEDGRISAANKEWAKGFSIPNDDVRWHFTVESHPGLTDIFLNQARKAWQALGLFEGKHCTKDEDYRGKVVVIRPDVLKDEFKTPENQLFYAEGGNGCRLDSLGTKVFGQHLNDGEKGYYRRAEIAGVLSDEFMPEWAKAKPEAVRSVEEADAALEMGGIT